MANTRDITWTYLTNFIKSIANLLIEDVKTQSTGSEYYINFIEKIKKLENAHLVKLMKQIFLSLQKDVSLPKMNIKGLVDFVFLEKTVQKTCDLFGFNLNIFFSEFGNFIFSCMPNLRGPIIFLNVNDKGTCTMSNTQDNNSSWLPDEDTTDFFNALFEYEPTPPKLRKLDTKNTEKTPDSPLQDDKNSLEKKPCIKQSQAKIRNPFLPPDSPIISFDFDQQQTDGFVQQSDISVCIENCKNNVTNFLENLTRLQEITKKTMTTFQTILNENLGDFTNSPCSGWCEKHCSVLNRVNSVRAPRGRKSNKCVENPLK